MTIARRSFLTGLAATLAAPAICRADSLMKVRGIVAPTTVVADLGLGDNGVLSFWMKRSPTGVWEFMTLTRTDGWVNGLPMPDADKSLIRGVASEVYLEVSGRAEGIIWPKT